MWTRSLLKDNAKSVLRRTYWTSFLVCLVFGILCGGGVTVASAYSRANAGSGSGYSDASYYVSDPAVLMVFVTVFVIVFVIGLIYSLFIASPIQVGTYRYFMEARGGNAPFTSMFSVFGKPGYGNVVKTSFFTSLRIFLWSLLLVIPGIIKQYEYYFVPYILAERPDIDTKRAMELSRQMTDGEKWNMFVLGLSFFGWILLGTLACGIGVLFVNPYIMATDAELYTALRTKAINAGITNEQELPGFVAYP